MRRVLSLCRWPSPRHRRSTGRYWPSPTTCSSTTIPSTVDVHADWTRPTTVRIRPISASVVKIDAGRRRPVFDWSLCRVRVESFRRSSSVKLALLSSSLRRRRAGNLASTPPRCQHHLVVNTTSLSTPPRCQHHLVVNTTSLSTPPRFKLGFYFRRHRNPSLHTRSRGFLSAYQTFFEVFYRVR